MELSDRTYRDLATLMHSAVGLSFNDSKKALVSSRLAPRVQRLGLGGYDDYLALIQADDEGGEFQIAVDLLTTNETYFFREPKHFDFLRSHALPELKGQSTVRVWSGACSSGEEPYTIAMVMAEVLGGRPWEIVASDLSTRVLTHAREGRYPMDDAAGIPRPLLAKYCLKGIGSQDGTFMMKPELRGRINFRQINLNAALPEIGQFDVIFLRNVMIYFDLETKRQVIRRILPLLRPGGYFMLSHSENLNGVSDALKTVLPSIYRKPAA